MKTRFFKLFFHLQLFMLVICLSCTTNDEMLRGEWQRITNNGSSETTETLVFGSNSSGFIINNTKTEETELSALNEMSYTINKDMVILKGEDGSETQYTLSEDGENTLLLQGQGNPFVKVSDDISKYH